MIVVIAYSLDHNSRSISSLDLEPLVAVLVLRHNGAFVNEQALWGCAVLKSFAKRCTIEKIADSCSEDEIGKLGFGRFQQDEY